MPCDHTGPEELVEMAEAELRQRQIDPASWDGWRFRFGENIVGGMWASIDIGVERRDGEWVVTRLDRSREALPESETGFRVIESTSDRDEATR